MADLLSELSSDDEVTNNNKSSKPEEEEDSDDEIDQSFQFGGILVRAGRLTSTAYSVVCSLTLITQSPWFFFSRPPTGRRWWTSILPRDGWMVVSDSSRTGRKGQ